MKSYLNNIHYVSDILYRESFTKAQILLLVRNKVVSNWRMLLKVFGLNYLPMSQMTRELERYVIELVKLGYIKLEITDKLNINYNIDYLIKHKQYIFTNKWNDVEKAFNITLTELASIGYESIIVNPLFPLPEKTGKSIDVFALMPFSNGFDNIYDNHIKPTIEKYNFSISRADYINSSSSIMSDIWNSIYFSKFIIADCTGANANVFYEIGISHCVGKKVILLTQNIKDIPFDTSYLRYIKYDLTDLAQLDKELSLYISNVVQRK